RVHDDRGVTGCGVLQAGVAAGVLRVVPPATEHEHDRQVVPQAGLRHLDDRLAGFAIDGEGQLAQVGVIVRGGTRPAPATVFQAADDAVDDAREVLQVSCGGAEGAHGGLCLGFGGSLWHEGEGEGRCYGECSGQAVAEDSAGLSRLLSALAGALRQVRKKVHAANALYGPSGNLVAPKTDP